MSTNISGNPSRASVDLAVEQTPHTSPSLKTSGFSLLSPTSRKTASRNSTNTIRRFSGQYNTSPAGSPVATRKALTSRSLAQQVISFLRDICSKAFKPKHTAFNEIAGKLLNDNSGDWKAQITSEMHKLPLESFKGLIADLDTFKLRGFDREVIAHIVTTMASIAENLSSLSPQEKDKIKSLQALFTPDALSKPEDRAKFKPSLQFAPSVLTVATPEVAGKGAVNTVLKVPYTSSKGESKVGVFKEDPSQMGGAKKIKETLFGTAKASGIPVDKEPHFASRAVASSAVDELLFPGNPISVRTQFATVNGMRGILMEKADGASPQIARKETITIPPDVYEDIIDDKSHPTPRELNLVAASLKLRNVTVESTDPLVLKGDKVIFSNFTPDNPRTIEGLLKLQVKDFITGQVDRHPGNYFISESGDITGIDEDCSFGINAIPPDGEDIRGQKALKGFIPNNSSLMLREPPAVTREIKDAVNTLAKNKEQLRESLKPYLTEQEIDATISRLDRLNAHINSDNCQVVETPEDLFSKEVQKYTDSNNSYWARECMVFDDTQKGWNHLRSSREV